MRYAGWAQLSGKGRPHARCNHIVDICSELCTTNGQCFMHPQRMAPPRSGAPIVCLNSRYKRTRDGQPHWQHLVPCNTGGPGWENNYDNARPHSSSELPSAGDGGASALAFGTGAGDVLASEAACANAGAGGASALVLSTGAGDVLALAAGAGNVLALAVACPNAGAGGALALALSTGSWPSEAPGVLSMAE